MLLTNDPHWQAFQVTSDKKESVMPAEQGQARLPLCTRHPADGQLRAALGSLPALLSHSYLWRDQMTEQTAVTFTGQGAEPKPAR